MSTTAARRTPERLARLTAVRTPAPPREFPVRFNPTSGIAALLNRPQNSFRWVGAGTVRLDEQGVHVTAKRLTPLGPRRTVRLIAPSELRQVYREGAMVRIDLQTAEEGGRTFHFWAAGARSAADLVRLLPTSRTIELESASGMSGTTGASRAGELSALDSDSITLRRFLWVALGAAGVATVVWVALTRSPVIQQPPVILPPPAPAAQLGNPQTLADLEKFTPRFDALTTQFATAFDALQRGNLSQQQFADGLEKWLLPQWDTLAAQLPAEQDAQGPPLRAIADSWRRALQTYVRGLRTNDSREVLQAFDYIRDAESYQKESRTLLSRLTDR